jgi:UDP-N-acetylglucosamine--N-acetylmuramyl-(pentapeptide) pyrophosphoryl-undecaprenol N-acetylglucosamine transferase
MPNPRFIVTGGGTGGHIYPALAVAGELKSLYPEAALLYVGGRKGLEGDLVPREGYEFKSLEIRGLERSISFSAIISAWKAFTSVFQAIRIIKDFKPDAVVGTGGYASFPVGAAAILCKVPLILHEQNVYPGLANRMLGRFAKGLAISWEGSRPAFKGHAEIVHTGNPIRASITGTNRQQALSRLGLEPASKTVLVFGGSQGAQKITRAAIDAMKLSIEDDIRVILATGKANFTASAVEAKSKGVPFADSLEKKGHKFYIVPYLHDMAAALSVCDIVVSRSGALTLAEITAKGLPSILIPHPFVPDDVQRKNASAMQSAGAAVMIENAALDGVTLKSVADGLLADHAKLTHMSEAALALAMPDAAPAVAKLVLRHMKGGNA